MYIRFMERIPNSIFYSAISLLLILVGVVLTNLYFMTAITMEVAMQALNSLASVCTLGAFIIAIMSMSSWKKQYAVTKIDSKFDELRKSYFYAARCFFDYFFNEESLLDLNFESNRNKPTDELLNEIRKSSLKSEALALRYEEANREYSMAYIMINPYLKFLTREERLELELVRVDWEKALDLVKASNVNTRYYETVRDSKRKAFSDVKSFSVKHNELFERIESHIRKRIG